jgi:hypothetical protein
LTKKWYNFCHDIDRSVIAYPNQPVPRGQNIIYPITGSIGLREAVKSFLRIAVQEGALDTFTDELPFMTTVDAKAGATITLTRISDRLRLVSDNANVEGNRADVHKVKISLAFPKARPAQVSKKQRLGLPERVGRKDWLPAQSQLAGRLRTLCRRRQKP